MIMSSDTKHGEPPTLPGHPARGFVAEPGQSKAAKEAARLADAERSSAADATRKGGSTSKSVAEHVRRDIRLAQAYNLVQNGDYWMSQPSEPTPLIKYSSASRLYEDAADIFRAYGRWRYAGEAYAKAGEAESSLNQPVVAATNFVDGGDMFEKVDAGEAVKCFERAVALYAVLGHFVPAATTQQRVAEILYADGALDEASEAFKNSADYFLGDDCYSQAVQMIVRSAECLCEDGSYERAHGMFDRAAYFAADDNICKLRVPKYMLQAGLCSLSCGDLDGCENYVVECCKRNEEFAVGREKRFLLDLVDVASAGLIDDFIDHAWNYDNVYGFDPFEINMLEIVYKRMQEGANKKKSDDDDDKNEGEEDEAEVHA